MSYINFTIYIKQISATAETGESGYAPSKDWIQIWIDPKNQKYGFKEVIEKHIPATVYHEMNHAARWGTVGYGDTLLQAIVTEGLACVFEKEQWKEFVAPWAAFDEEEIARLMKILQGRDEAKDGAYNHSEWFYGGGKLPRWIGYKLGAYIVGQFREKNSGLSWPEMVKLPAEGIIDKSGIRI